MRIAVVGGTGNAGSKTIRRIQRHGHEAVAVSRSGDSVSGAPGKRADIMSGEGLAEAFDGVEGVVDCSNTTNLLDTRIFTTGARNVVAAATEAGVERAVLLSIVGLDKSTFSYHQRKLDQEHIYLDSKLDACVVRATQFHEFPVMYFEGGAAVGAIPVFLGARFQTVDVGEVADVLALEAIEPSGKRIIDVGGPDVRVSRDLAKAWQQQTHARGLIVNGPFPPSLLKFYREGANLLPASGHRGVVTFEEWLRNRR